MRAASPTRVPLVCRECGAGPLTSEESMPGLVLAERQTADARALLPESGPGHAASAPTPTSWPRRRGASRPPAPTDPTSTWAARAQYRGQGPGRAHARPLAAARRLRTLRKAVSGRFTIKIRGLGRAHAQRRGDRAAGRERGRRGDPCTRARARSSSRGVPWEVIAAVVAPSRRCVGNGDVRSVTTRTDGGGTGCAA